MAVNDVEKNLDQVIKEAAHAMDASHYLEDQTLHFQDDDHCNEPFEQFEKNRLPIDREARIKAFFEMIAGEHAAGDFSMF